MRFLIVLFTTFLLSAAAFPQTRSVEGFTKSEIKAYLDNGSGGFKGSKTFRKADLQGIVKSATKHEKKPFYGFEFNGTKYWALGSAFEFSDNPVSSTLKCNSSRSMLKASRHQSSSASGQQAKCGS